MRRRLALSAWAAAVVATACAACGGVSADGTSDAAVGDSRQVVEPATTAGPSHVRAAASASDAPAPPPPQPLPSGATISPDALTNPTPEELARPGLPADQYVDGPNPWETFFDAGWRRFASVAEAQAYVSAGQLPFPIRVPRTIPGELAGVFISLDADDPRIGLLYLSEEYRAIIVLENPQTSPQQEIEELATMEHCPFCSSAATVTLAGGQKAALREGRGDEPTAVIWNQGPVTMWLFGPGERLPVDVAVEIANDLSTQR